VFFYDSLGSSARTPTEVGQTILDHFDTPASTFGT